jgi:hypothetical protein
LRSEVGIDKKSNYFNSFKCLQAICEIFATRK